MCVCVCARRALVGGGGHDNRSEIEKRNLTFGLYTKIVNLYNSLDQIQHSEVCICVCICNDSKTQQASGVKFGE